MSQCAIYRYDEEETLPKSATILHVERKPGEANRSVWASVSLADDQVHKPSAERTGPRVLRLGTGHPVAADVIVCARFICTQVEGYFVWHFFEVRP